MKVTKDWHDDSWPSSKGLSVFNALRISGAMTPEQIRDYLRTNWDPVLPLAYVAGGIDFLDGKGWIAHDGDAVRLVVNGAALRSADESDLLLTGGN
jgi:hypothetical protein